MIHLNDGFWGGRAVAQCTVGSFGVVMLSPLFDQNLCFLEAVKDLTIQEFIPKASVEALAVAILPG